MKHLPTRQRLDADTRRKLERLARRTGKKRSGIVGDTIGRPASKTEKVSSGYALIADLIGVAAGGPPGLSQKTGVRFHKQLERRRKPLRPG